MSICMVITISSRKFRSKTHISILCWCLMTLLQGMLGLHWSSFGFWCACAKYKCEFVFKNIVVHSVVVHTILWSFTYLKEKWKQISQKYLCQNLQDANSFINITKVVFGHTDKAEVLLLDAFHKLPGATYELLSLYMRSLFIFHLVNRLSVRFSTKSFGCLFYVLLTLKRQGAVSPPPLLCI